jgi:lipopolysaccharide transport system ATP-binding protein
MADDVVIRAEGLGKKYLIGHAAERERYVALRDVLVRSVRNLWRKTADMALGRAMVGGDSVEEFWALRDVSFEVKRGEVLGIIGRNGAGKSTLLKILSRITEPTEGRLTINGRVASLLEVGTGFHPELTGRENIYLNGAILGMTRSEIGRKFDEIVAFAEVETFLDTPVKRYSSGMYVRLAFAVAAHLEPEILVVDEVLAVGDNEFQAKCLGKMKTVSGEGRTVLFVSHNLAAIRALCSAGIFLSEGRIAYKGTISNITQAYVLNSSISTDSTWDRPKSLPLPLIGFETISISLSGAQPRLTLTCQARLRCQMSSPHSFIAANIRDQTLSVIMQAVPEPRPFIPGTPGMHNISLDIDLPPLIPGTYWIDFWLGHHYTKTVDYIGNPVSFQVTDSPSPGRSFPHSIDYGAIAPTSRVTSCVWEHI